MAIPEANGVEPGVYSQTTSVNPTGLPAGAGNRVACLIGEGSTDQTIVFQAQGGGADGLNPTYTSSSGADGRHFLISNAPLVSNRTTLYKNGVPLVGIEEAIDSSSFSFNYDYRVDIETGKVELQKAHLVDQGGAFYLPLSSNVGTGTIGTLTLEDANASPETWSIRCVSVQRNGSNVPIAGTAKFLAFGSVSGAKLDSNGNPIVWLAAGPVVSNGILSFAIGESSPVFREGDGFTIKVASGVLVRGNSLTVNCIPSQLINLPVLTSDLVDVINTHGSPSLDNTVSLAAQLAYANSAPTLYTLQAAPAMPRRVSYILTESLNANSTNDDDFIFPLPLGVAPDVDTSIHFFVTNNSTNVETQILPNKLDYYLLDTSGKPTTHAFIVDATPAPGGYSYFYTVKSSLADLADGFDGYLTRTGSPGDQGLFASSFTFDSSFVGKKLNLIDATNVGNIGTYTVTAVSGGKLSVTKDALADLTSGSGVSFQIVDPVTLLPVSGGTGTDGVLTASAGTHTAKITSSAVVFTGIAGIATKKIKITSGVNAGLYDNTSFNAGTGELTFTKVIVTEHDMRYEVLDPDSTSQFIVINKNVVPNGYGVRVTLIDTRDADFYDAGWINALEAIENIEIDMLSVFPKQTPSVIFQNALAHCRAMSNIRNRKERFFLTGAINGLTPANVLGTSLAAVENIGILEGIQGDSVTEILAGNVEDLGNYSVKDAFGSTFRCQYFYPDQINIATSETIQVDGFYMAAAACGYLSADLSLPNSLTNKVLSGFTIPAKKQYRSSVLEQMSAAGITVLKPVQGGGKVIWSRTTSSSTSALEQEPSVIFIRDRVAKVSRAAFENFPGQPNTSDIVSLVTAQATILLQSFVSGNLITGYRNLSVVVDPADPRQIDISFEVAPIFPLLFVFIKIGIGIF